MPATTDRARAPDGHGLERRMSERFTFSLDGRPVTVDADPKAPALGVLREQLGVQGCKAGCSPQGLCGCCTVLIEGKPRLTCTLPTKSLAGKVITTLDGLPEADRDLLADSFVRAGATQCGYCTPGIVLSAWALLQGDASPGPEAVTRALNQHTCRCTGYTSIHAAIGAAAAVRRGEACPLPASARPEGRAIVLGERPYVDDLERPGMLHGALVLAPAARGRVTRLDLGDATAVILRGVGDEVVHAGDVVAVVAAEDAAAARRAAAAAVVELEEVPEAAEGVVARGRRVDGDVAAALAACVHTVEATYTLAATDPVYLEPEAALAVPVMRDDGSPGLVVYSQGHDASAEARALAEAVGVPVRVVLVPSGGSYGGKEAGTVQLAAARLAVETGRSVRVATTLEQGMRVHRRRPGAVVRVRAGCAADGAGLVLDVEATFDGGADTHAGDRIVGQALGAVPYAGLLAVDARVVASAGSPTGPIRGAGGIAVAFGVERAIDGLAGRLGMDALELRRRNVEGEAVAVLAALAPAWADGSVDGVVRRGVGLARVDGSGGARVVLTVTGPASVEVQCNVPELGQGRDETLVGALVDATGLPAEVFEVAWGDSDVVGAGALASAPVAEAARRAGEALARAGGSLDGHVGARFVGEDAERGAPGWAAHVVGRDEAGVVRAVWTAVAVGDGQDPRLAARLAEGAAHMGVGIALSEEVEERAGLPEGRFRMLGVLKPKGSPALHVVPVVVGGGHREVSEVAVLAVPGAVAGALDAEGALARLPMRETAAAKAVGARQARPAAAGSSAG